MARKTLFVAIFALISLGAMTEEASAHTSVVATNPTYKSTLAAMPEEISIEFTENLMTLGDKAVNVISITAPDGLPLNIEEIKVSGRILSATLPPKDYQAGTYIVSYRVVSADGHGVSGSYELYLEHPSTSSQENQESKGLEGEAHSDGSHSGFLHLHQTHLIEAGVIFILLILWWGYRRFNQD